MFDVPLHKSFLGRWEEELVFMALGEEVVIVVQEPAFLKRRVLAQERESWYVWGVTLSFRQKINTILGHMHL